MVITGFRMGIAALDDGRSCGLLPPNSITDATSRMAALAPSERSRSPPPLAAPLPHRGCRPEIFTSATLHTFGMKSSSKCDRKSGANSAACAAKTPGNHAFHSRCPARRRVPAGVTCDTCGSGTDNHAPPRAPGGVRRGPPRPVLDDRRRPDASPARHPRRLAGSHRRRGGRPPRDPDRVERVRIARAASRVPRPGCRGGASRSLPTSPLAASPGAAFDRNPSQNGSLARCSRYLRARQTINLGDGEQFIGDSQRSC